LLVVFLHGFLGTGNDWTEVIKHLPFPCMTFDLPGHGNSLPDFDLFAEMEKLPPFHLVGYSMGGRLCLQYSGKTLSLTLISTHLGLQTELEKQERLSKDQVTAEQILSTPIDQFLSQWYDQPLFSSLRSKIDICGLRKKQTREGLADALMKFSLGKQPDYSNKKAQYILGEKDEKYRTLYQKIPHTLIPDAGHAVHLENPILLAKEIYERLLSNEVQLESMR